MLLTLYYGWRFRGGPVLLALGAIGQVSLINSFAHMHTPILITIIRTGWGLGLGIVLGLVLLGLLHLIRRNK
jgi:thiamine transporter ThiT